MKYDTIWDKLDQLIDRLEEDLTFQIIKQSNSNQEIDDTNCNRQFFLLDDQKKVLNKLIFWTLCSEMKEGHYLLDVFLNNQLTLKKKDSFAPHILGQLCTGNLYPDETFKESEEYRILYGEAQQREEEIYSQLDDRLKDIYDQLMSDYSFLLSQNSTESFVHGFQFAAKMFLGIYLEYST